MANNAMPFRNPKRINWCSADADTLQELVAGFTEREERICWKTISEDFRLSTLNPTKRQCQDKNKNLQAHNLSSPTKIIAHNLSSPKKNTVQKGSSQKVDARVKGAFTETALIIPRSQILLGPLNKGAQEIPLPRKKKRRQAFVTPEGKVLSRRQSNLAYKKQQNCKGVLSMFHPVLV
jgi:hypothetical protein